MAVTLDQVYALLTAISSKVDALLTEEGILMSQTSDIQNATDLITAEVAQLNDSYTQLSALVGQLRGQGVDQAVLDQFDQALSTLKPSVDRIASITPQPAPSPVSTQDPDAGQQAQPQPPAQQDQQAQPGGATQQARAGGGGTSAGTAQDGDATGSPGGTGTGQGAGGAGGTGSATAAAGQPGDSPGTAPGAAQDQAAAGQQQASSGQQQQPQAAADAAGMTQPDPGQPGA